MDFRYAATTCPYDPVFAVYRKSSLAGLEAALGSDRNQIIDALSSSRVKYIQLDSSFRFTNLNTVEDYLKFTGKKKKIGHKGTKLKK